MSKTKIEILNPNTGRKMNIDADVYGLFSKAIYDTLKKDKRGITYTEMVKGTKKYFKEKRIAFKGSIDSYPVSVKPDMVANRIIETWMEEGTGLHKLTQ